MPVQQISVKNSSEIESWEWGGGCGRETVRTGSGSSQTSCSNCSGDICRICHCESEPQNPLLAPCYCSGSLKYVHQSCLQQWLTASETRSCELCKFNFIMHTKIKPFNEWRLLEMSGVERRRLCCAVLFHCVAALCVMWSLFVLIERAVEEVNRGLIAWPFWTKLVVVAVGFTGGAVFMYIQCRQYLHLCNRWRAHNRILLIQNAPEKMAVCGGSPPVVAMRGPRGVRGQVVANIEPSPPPAAFHEEDESGGFETYRPPPPRRLAPPDERIPPRRASDPRLAAPPAAPPALPSVAPLAIHGVYHIAVDPLEADIRSLLALEAQRQTARSLPNLRASRESLLPPAS
ncbi:E3 ubiquitin-protein ligase MARCHF8 [Bombyx mori]|uniref:E3 ubiquitin-protein ligase MARCH8 n=1 Tax=Bombyx mori TaxID=7091 RepID=A0A8R2M835_BOMMO|nr:E3 ubiquitin-protein ligase MARCHF8 [Bombyx mori]